MTYIDEIDLSNKKVVIRCDYNVPIKDGKVEDDSRIVKSLNTLKFLLEKNCSLVIMSHLGKIKSEEDKSKNTLAPVAEILSQKLNREVKFLANPVGMEVLKTCKDLQNGEVVLLENTRYCDIPEKLESSNDEGLSEYWSKLGDIFVVDAFGSMHRAHSSVAGISKYLPTYYGFLIKEEIEGLKPVVENPIKPFGVFMGGAKIDDKLGYIKYLLPKCDYLMVGGGIANSFLHAAGYNVGESLKTDDPEIINELKQLMETYKDKLILPVDFEFSGKAIYDLGAKSIEKYNKYFNKCKTIFMNGSCGKFEEKEFAKGTIDLISNFRNIDAYKVAGGGDTLNVVNEYSLNDAFNFLSTGGGASLEYVSEGHHAAIDYIENTQNH